MEFRRRDLKKNLHSFKPRFILSSMKSRYDVFKYEFMTKPVLVSSVNNYAVAIDRARKIDGGIVAVYQNGKLLASKTGKRLKFEVGG